jgi:hypothetical protein
MVGNSSHPPAHELIFLKVGSLDDVKTNNSDTGAARSMALDHLGIIASRLRSTCLKFGSRSSTEGSENRILRPMEEVFIHLLLGLRSLLINWKIYSNLNVSELDARVSAHREIFSFLCKHTAEDQSYDASSPLFSCSITNFFPECPGTHWSDLGARARFCFETMPRSHN